MTKYFENQFKGGMIHFGSWFHKFSGHDHMVPLFLDYSKAEHYGRECMVEQSY
jgi:hypothetical protein